MTDKVYAHGSVIQMLGMNHVIGVMANEKQAEDIARIINAHDDLVKALMAIYNRHNTETMAQARDALEKAGAA